MWAGYRLGPLWESSSQNLQEDAGETLVWWQGDTKIQKDGS